MPYKDPEKRKEIKRLNYIKNAEKIKARMERNRRKNGIPIRAKAKTAKAKEINILPVSFTKGQIENQLRLIGTIKIINRQNQTQQKGVYNV